MMDDERLKELNRAGGRAQFHKPVEMGMWLQECTEEIRALKSELQESCDQQSDVQILQKENRRLETLVKLQDAELKEAREKGEAAGEAIVRLQQGLAEVIAGREESRDE